MDKYLQVGQILKPKGLDGTVKVRVDAKSPDVLLSLPYVYTKNDKNYIRHVFKDAYENNGFVYLKLDNCQKMEDAEALRNNILYMDREDAPALENNEFYIVDLIGCEIITDKGNNLGRIVEVLQPGANDVYVVKKNKKNLLIPVLKHIIISFDIPAKRIVFDSVKLSEVILDDH